MKLSSNEGTKTEEFFHNFVEALFSEELLKSPGSDDFRAFQKPHYHFKFRRFIIEKEKK